MFICHSCCDKKGIDSFYQMFAGASRGLCEFCGESASCCDIHHSKIPNTIKKIDSVTGQSLDPKGKKSISYSDFRKKIGK
jgi:hypothetical protein